MNKHPSRRTRACAARIGTLTAVAGAVLAVSMPVVAQGTSQTITVTGIRRAVESAISVKKNSDNIVEAISSEDIGKLPDTSIAESLTRLPGVAAQRNAAGRASTLSFRGFAPDFSTGLLNGREQVSTGDSRFPEFDQYPSELLNQVVVSKTPDAALVGQGLSATVDMQTIKPLDRSGRVIAVNYRKTKLGVGTLAEGDGDRFSLAYVDQFADRKIGVALGFARLDEKGPVTERFDSWGGGQANFGTPPASVNVPYNGFGLFADQRTEKRDGVMAVLQFKPNKNFSSTVDFFQSKFDRVKSTKGFQAPLNDSWQSGPYDDAGQLTAATVSGGNATAGTFNNVRAVVRNDAEDFKDELRSIGWNSKLTAGAWNLTADLSASMASKEGAIVETTAGVAQAALGTWQRDTLQFTNTGQFTPGLNYADRNIIKLTDVQGWGGGVGSPQAGYSKLPSVEDELRSVRLSAKRDLPNGMFISAIEGGVNFGDREKVREFVEGRLVIVGGNPLGAVDVPGSATNSIRGINFVSFDPAAAVGPIYDVVAKVHPDIYNKDWRVTEKTSTFYVKGDIDRTLFGLPVRGNVGVQVINAKQASFAFNVDRPNCTGDTPATCPGTDTTRSASHTDVLPSLNLVFDIGADQVMRFGLGRQMARPVLNDMRASLAVSYDQTNNILRGDAGNPTLKPWRANAVDLTYEKYFGTKAYFAVAGFYKQLSSYILRQNVLFDFTNFASPTTLAQVQVPPGGDPSQRGIGLINMPVNGEGGYVKGLDMAVDFPLNMLDKSLDGFGVQANVSSNSSSVALDVRGFAVAGIDFVDIPLPGLSRNSSNVTVYYEKAGFGLRLAQRQRSKFIGEITTIFGDRELTFIKSERVVDAQLSYEIQSGPLKGLQFLAQGSNLNNSSFIRFRREPSNLPGNQAENTKYGKTYLFGVNYRL